MKKTLLSAVLVGMAALGATVFAPGCEEVLEVCAPCGSVADGDVTISGDPTLDGVFETVQRLRRFAEQAAREYDADRVLLEETFGVSASAAPAELGEGVGAALFAVEGATVVIDYEPGRCWVPADPVLERELACEQRRECTLPRKPRKHFEEPACVGLFIGKCSARCLGDCFDDPEGDEKACPGECIGVCTAPDGTECPGRCTGTCAGACSAYTAQGDCAGRCLGACSGECESPLPAPCGGSCDGLCSADVEAGDLCRGECRGACVDHAGRRVGEGACRGHLRPEGFDEECGECRETAKGLAWAMMTCEGSRVRVGAELGDGFEGDRVAFLQQVRVLERVLGRAASTHAALQLLVDGVDVTGELEPEDLVEEPGVVKEIEFLEDATFLETIGVINDRKFTPLSNIKARVGMLADEATSADFGAVVSASALPCVGPAFEEAQGILQTMIPSAKTAGELVMDRGCSGGDYEGEVPCLYRVVDGQAALLGLAAPGS